MAGQIPPQAWQLLAQGMKVVARGAEPCKVGDCTAHSLGFRCVTCSRPVCLRHGFMTLAVPPKPICASCIISENDALLRDLPGQAA